MAYFAEEDEYYQEEVEGPFQDQMEEKLVQALGHHVQDSVNQALIKALKPFTVPLVRFGQRELMGPPPSGSRVREPQVDEGSLNPKASLGSLSLAEILSQMATAVLKDHEYGPGLMNVPDVFPPPSGSRKELSQSADSHSDSEFSEPKQAGKRKAHHIPEEEMTQRNVLFDPENINNPRSTEWVPCVEVWKDRLGRSFDKDVRSILRLECPHPSLLGKVANTLELVPSVATFLKKFTKDPKEGLDRAWKGCQDKMLDLSGPITKILELAVQAKESGTPLELEAVLEWAQRAICFLGNANCAMSTER
ncbi:hypothetical protein NDU88_006033 [Pleurodeles waltl]|uniref:Uncharacterized protein n=1 Tax=Pleurodeles waltl TaxID=8319 RepID=A0AAV7QGT5_PLEWA|nr:hypothetical protein NDU88_006033 [Pleurodeles waltl]